MLKMLLWSNILIFQIFHYHFICHYTDKLKQNKRTFEVKWRKKYSNNENDEKSERENDMIWMIGGARGVMVIVAGIGHADTSSNPDCISHSTNTLGKGMNPIILPRAMDK